jgi:hypothetical protein
MILHSWKVLWEHFPKRQGWNWMQLFFLNYFPALESIWIVIDGHSTSGLTLELHVQCAHTSKCIDGLVQLWTEPVWYSGQRAELELNQTTFEV